LVEALSTLVVDDRADLDFATFRPHTYTEKGAQTACPLYFPFIIPEAANLRYFTAVTLADKRRFTPGFG
jgi:hypothetical protein